MGLKTLVVQRWLSNLAGAAKRFFGILQPIYLAIEGKEGIDAVLAGDLNISFI